MVMAWRMIHLLLVSLLSVAAAAIENITNIQLLENLRNDLRTLIWSNNNYAVCVITTSVELAHWAWLDELAQHAVSVYIFVDVDENMITHLSDDFFIVSISHDISKSLGYHGAWNKHETSTVRANAWDKALLYFTEIVTSYDFVWFLEDDVYIHSLSSFLRVHEDTMRAKADFAVKSISEKGAKNKKFQKLYLKSPLYNSLVCACGLSRKLLTEVKRFVDQHHQPEYVEVFFGTLAKQHGMNVFLPKQLQMLEYRCDYTCNDLKEPDDHWFHPIKDQIRFMEHCLEWYESHPNYRHLKFSTNGLDDRAHCIREVQESDRSRYLSSINSGNNEEATNKFAVCILASSTNWVPWSWLHELARHHISAYMIVETDRATHDVDITNIHSRVSESLGYLRARVMENSAEQSIHLWDKAMLYFTEIATKYEFVWFLEDDVYIHSLSSFLRVHEDAVRIKADISLKDAIPLPSKAYNDTIELLTIGNSSVDGGPALYAVGISLKQLKNIKQIFLGNQQIDTLEEVLNALVILFKVCIHRPPQFRLLQHQGNYSCYDMNQHQDQWFHPVIDQNHFINHCQVAWSQMKNLSSIPNDSLAWDSSNTSSIGMSYSGHCIREFQVNKLNDIHHHHEFSGPHNPLSELKSELDYGSRFHLSNQYAVCVITTTLTLAQWTWLGELSRHNISAYILVDMDETALSFLSNGVTVISIHHSVSTAIGYHSSSTKKENSKERAKGWDKSLLYFSEIATKYEFVWFIEDDVYIHSLSSFLRVHEDAMRAKADLAAKEIISKHSKKYKRLYLKEPVFISLVPAVGVSRQILLEIRRFVAQYHRLEYIELMFPTLAMQHKLSIYQPSQFRTIKFRCNYSCEDMFNMRDQWLHPIKDQMHFVQECEDSAYDGNEGDHVGNYSLYNNTDGYDHLGSCF